MEVKSRNKVPPGDRRAALDDAMKREKVRQDECYSGQDGRYCTSALSTADGEGEGITAKPA
jgi:hypothetical protein